MYRIRRFGVMKTATVVAVMYVVVVAIFIIPFAVLTVGFRGDGGGGAAFLAFGLFAALIYGAIGWVFTAIACALYNVVAGFVGGIEVQVELVAPPAPTPTWSPTGGTPTTPTPPSTTPYGS